MPTAPPQIVFHVFPILQPCSSKPARRVALSQAPWKNRLAPVLKESAQFFVWRSPGAPHGMGPICSSSSRVGVGGAGMHIVESVLLILSAHSLTAWVIFT